MKALKDFVSKYPLAALLAFAVVAFIAKNFILGGGPEKEFKQPLTPEVIQKARIAEMHQKAEAGNVKVMMQLADMYTTGKDGPKDLAKAAHWLSAAADKGNAQAMYRAGVVHMTGRGVPQDPGRAAEYWEKAVAKNEPKSMYLLGLIYTSNPKGQNADKGVEYLKKRAARQHPASVVLTSYLKLFDTDARRFQPARVAKSVEKSGIDADNDITDAINAIESARKELPRKQRKNAAELLQPMVAATWPDVFALGLAEIREEDTGLAGAILKLTGMDKHEKKRVYDRYSRFEKHDDKTLLYYELAQGEAPKLELEWKADWLKNRLAHGTDAQAQYAYFYARQLSNIGDAKQAAIMFAYARLTALIDAGYCRDASAADAKIKTLDAIVHDIRDYLAAQPQEVRDTVVQTATQYEANFAARPPNPWLCGGSDAVVADREAWGKHRAETIETFPEHLAPEQG